MVANIVFGIMLVVIFGSILVRGFILGQMWLPIRASNNVRRDENPGAFWVTALVNAMMISAGLVLIGVTLSNS